MKKKRNKRKEYSVYFGDYFFEAAKKRTKKKNFIIWLLIFLSILVLGKYLETSKLVNQKDIMKFVLLYEIGVPFVFYFFISSVKIMKNYFPLIAISVSALIIVYSLIKVFPNGDITKSDLLSFCGSYLTFIGTLGLGYFIYVQDCRKLKEEKQRRVSLLHELISTAELELYRLSKLLSDSEYIKQDNNRKRIEQIPFNANWIIYYQDYESLMGSNYDLKTTLSSFFSMIGKVNISIDNNQMETALSIYRRYYENEDYSTSKYNMLEATVCLQEACSDLHILNTKSWIEREETKKVIIDLCEKYFYIIENFIYICLLRNNGKDSSRDEDLQRKTVDWLLENSPEIKEIIKYPSDKRIISKVVSICSLKFTDQSKRIDYVWGEYSLK